MGKDVPRGIQSLEVSVLWESPQMMADGGIGESSVKCVANPQSIAG
jgi:hypothetical protein